MVKERIVLDTNVFISALGWEGNPRIIFDRVIAGEFELILSYKQFNELVRVLDYPKFRFTDEQKNRFLSILLEVAILVKTESEVDVVKEDRSDNVILEPVQEMKIDYVISGNDHLLKLKGFRGTKIVNPQEFLEIVA
ncbi:MAG TPA: putative toxin-antitoxin system toxin component, PIN family [Candidatus Nanoarchaeia archaeon]|nr:putative toxin-antitoxin system toxin component, PIN family [Candidatus Nanoarchaeia archaeon]